MPALKVFGCGEGKKGITTRPFAGDDLQILCLLFGIYRVIQLACIFPFWVKLFLYRLYGHEFIGPNGQPSWCIDPIHTVVFSTDTDRNLQKDSNFTTIDDVIQEDRRNTSDYGNSMMVPFSIYLIISLIYTIIDMALSFAIWSAASVGTPTEPRGRNQALQSLIFVKIVFMNLILVFVLGSGIYMIHVGRKYNYGCGPEMEDMQNQFESSIWYTMFKLTMVTYAFEFLVWPCILTNQIAASIVYQYRRSDVLKYIFLRNKSKKSNDVLTRSAQRQHELRDRQHKNIGACLGGCCKFLQCLSCNKLGGGNIRAHTDLRDVAVAFMDFFNYESDFDIVLSDIYIAFKLLGRVNKERKYKSSKQAQLDELNKNNDLMHDEDNCSRLHRNEKKTCELVHNTLYDTNGSFDFRQDHSDVSRKEILQHTPSDMQHIRLAARYSHYALGMYDEYQKALLAAGRLVGGLHGIYNPSESDHTSSQDEKLSTSSFFRLVELGFQETMVVFARFDNDILSTPYAILIDEQVKSVIVTIRGTASLEDLVTDLQLSAVSMEKVGEVCGFNPDGMHAHRGMLTKCKWIYNDIFRRNILCRLLTPNGECAHSAWAYQDYNLIFTGHSLGAGCAAILAKMFRPKYPHLHCYAYCPPGCSTSTNLSLECEAYVTSIVVGNDIIPRVKTQNFEILRYEFLELLARVKLPKIRVWKELRKSCRNKDLELRNSQLLHNKDEIPQNTPYFKKLISFRERRTRLMEERFPPHNRLSIPGRIVHLIPKGDKKNMKYLPYWESKDAFHELTLNADAVGDHSMDNLVIILDNIFHAYEHASNGGLHNDDSNDEDDQSHGTIGSSNVINFENDLTSDDRWFIFCARPRGSVTLIPSFLAIAGACFSVIGNNLCFFFLREIENTSIELPWEDQQVTGVALGLYSYGLEYYNEEVGDFVLQCARHPAHFEADIYLSLARGFSALALVIGFPVLILLSFGNCMKLSDRSFQRISYCLFVVAVFESLIFLYLKSDACNKPIFPKFDSSSCRLETGSKMAIVATVMWFMAAIFTAFIDNAILVEWKLSLLAMYVKRSIGGVQ